MENKKLLLINLSNEILKIDCDQPSNKIVKELDKLTQECFFNLYNLSYLKSDNKSPDKKNGHCC